MNKVLRDKMLALNKDDNEIKRFKINDQTNCAFT